MCVSVRVCACVSSRVRVCTHQGSLVVQVDSVLYSSENACFKNNSN